MRAMILAAGFGTRLWPLTADRTKPAIPILGKPLVGYVAEYLQSFGITDVVVNLHHQPDSVRAALGDGAVFGVRLDYIEEPIILGTSGALDNARHLFEDEMFVVINGKLITDIDLGAAIEHHRNANALWTLVLMENVARERFSAVEVCDGFVTGFGRMPTRQDDSAAGPPPLMFTGIQIFNRRIFDYIPRGVFSHSVTDVFPRAIAAGERIVAHVARGAWHELSTIRRYLDTSLELLARDGGDVQLGRGSTIESGADVRESVLWDNVTIETGARVRRAVIGEGVCILGDEQLENVAVVRGELVRGGARPEKALEGEFKGANFVVSLTQ